MTPQLRLLSSVFVFALIGSIAFADPKGNKASKGNAKKIVTFGRVQEVFENHCIDCHNSDVASGGLDLGTYRTTMAGGASGAVIEALNSGGSKLFSMVNHSERPFMPPKSPKINKADLEVLRQWIDQGARLDKNSPIPKAKAVKQTVKLPEFSGKAAIIPVLPKWMGPKLARISSVWSLSHSPRNDQLLSASYKRAFVFDSQSRMTRAELEFQFGFVSVVKFSRRGDAILIAGGTGAKQGKAEIWSVGAGKKLASLGTDRDTILAADIREDLQIVATGGPLRKIRVFELGSQTLRYEIKKHTNWVTSLSFSPDGVLMGSADRNGGMFLWESDRGLEFAELKGHSGSVTGLSWRLDSNVLASSSEDGQIILWRADDGANIRRWKAHNPGVLGVDFSRKGEIGSVGRDRRVKVWNQNGKLVKQSEALSALPLSLCWDSKGERLFVGLSNGQIRSWKPKTEKKTQNWSENGVPDARKISQWAQSQAKSTGQKIPTTEKVIRDLDLRLTKTKARLEGQQNKLRSIESIGHRLKTLQAQRKRKQGEIQASGKLLTEFRITVREQEEWTKQGFYSPEIFKQGIFNSFKAAKAQHQDLKQELKEQHASIATVSSEFKAVQKQRGPLKKTLEQLKASLNKLNKERSNKGKSLEQFRVRVKRFKKLELVITEEVKFRQLALKLTEIRERYRRQKDKVKDFESTLEAYEKEQESLPSRAKVLDSKDLELVAHVKRLKGEIGALQSKHGQDFRLLKIARARVETSMQLYKGLSQRAKVLMTKLANPNISAADTKSCSDKLAKLWDLVVTARHSADRDQAIQKSLETEFGTKLKRFDRLTAELREVEWTLTKVKKERSEVRKLLSELGPKLEAVYENLNGADSDLSDLKKSRKKLRKRLKTQQEKLNLLYEEIKDLS